jgi:cold shock CspA family protein
MNEFPIQITFHDLEHSDAVEAHLREKAEKLGRFSEDIMSCRVTVEMPRRHMHRGKLFNIRIDLSVKGDELVIDRNVSRDINIAIREAFDNARRLLEDYSRRRRGDVKVHEVAHAGVVTQLFPDQDYGFIRTPEGREIYFHRNSVVDGGFPLLEPGNEVHFVEEQGDQGLQALRVSRLSHHREAAERVDRG